MNQYNGWSDPTKGRLASRDFSLETEHIVNNTAQ
jgi:hypothetical protein